MCSLMMISDMLSKHVGAVKVFSKSDLKINDIQLVHLLVTCFQSSDDSLIFDTHLMNWFVDTLSITIGMNV